MQFARQLAFLALTSLAGDAAAQTLDTTIVTQSTRTGPLAGPHTEHARPLSYLPYVTPSPSPSAASVQHTTTLDYDVTLTNTTGLPVTGSLSVIAENKAVAGGTGSAVYCWGNSASTTAWLVRSGLVVPPGAALHVTGSLAFPGTISYDVPAPGAFGYLANGCTSDGLHMSGASSNLVTSPSLVQGFQFFDNGGGGPGVISVLDNGSSLTNELLVESRYRLSQVAGPQPCGSANPNSSGALGGLAAYGTTGPGGLVVLGASALPAGSVGYALIAASGQPATPMGSGLGSLCLASPVQRWSATVGAATPMGSRQIQVPQRTLVGPVVLSVGSTWHFQYWHRDFVGGAPTSNTTNSVVVTL